MEARHDLNAARREQVERTRCERSERVSLRCVVHPLRISSMLVRHVPPERSIAGVVNRERFGIVNAATARATRVAVQIGSEAMHAIQNRPLCSYFLHSFGWLLLNACWLCGWIRCRTLMVRSL